MGTVGQVQVFDFQFARKIAIYLAIELWPVVGYNRLGYSRTCTQCSSIQIEQPFIFDGCEGWQPVIDSFESGR